MNWKERLTESQNATVTGYEHERSAAVMDWLNGKISMTEARAIVAQLFVEDVLQGVIENARLEDLPE